MFDGCGKAENNMFTDIMVLCYKTNNFLVAGAVIQEYD